MTATLNQSNLDSKTFRYPSNRVTTPKPFKVHSADIAFLLVIRFFTLKGRDGYCHLTLVQWNEYLIRFGGKALKRSAFNAKRRKYLREGWIACWYPNRNRNLNYSYMLTESGIEGVNKYFDENVDRKKTDTRNALVEDPNKQKTDTPLNHEQGKKLCKDIKGDSPVDNPVMDMRDVMVELGRLGIKEDTLDKLACSYSVNELIYCIMETKRGSPIVGWSYFRRVLHNHFGNKGCFFRKKARHI